MSLEGDGEYWDALFIVLSEFCACSLEECVSRQLIEAGEEEHIARVSGSIHVPLYQDTPKLRKQDTFVCPKCKLFPSSSLSITHAHTHTHTHTHTQAVVLLLCLAVQRKPNKDVISRITTLQYKAQCDIMFFIEEALAKMKSNALGSGLFTSG